MNKIESPRTTWAATTFSPLLNHSFRSIWLAGAASNMGAVVQATSAAWLMTTMTSSPILIASVQTAASLPVVVSALAAGASADLYDKRKQMLIGNLLCFGAIAALVLFTVQGALTPFSLLVLTTLISLGFSAFLPAWHAGVMEIVSRSDLAASISLNNLAFNIARAVGPAIAVEIIALFGVAIAFGFSGVTYLIMIVTLVAWHHKSPVKELPPERLGRAMVDGIRFVSLSPGVRLHISRGFFLTLTASALLALPPVVAVELNLDARGFGVLLAAFGVGAMIGSLSVAWTRQYLTPQKQLFVATISLAASSIALAYCGTLFVAGAALFLGGIGWIHCISTLQMAVQICSPRWVLGRTISIFTMTFTLGIAIGSVLWGYLAQQTSLWLALLVAGVGQAVFAIYSSARHFDDPEEDQLKPQKGFSMKNAPDVDPRSGPVFLNLEYEVKRGNLPQFRTLMEECARIRRRDGARRWSLGQDINTPCIWIESFQSPTWGDYLHGTSRMLMSDDAIQQKVLSLCESDPKLSRRLKRSA